MKTATFWIVVLIACVATFGVMLSPVSDSVSKVAKPAADSLLDRYAQHVLDRHAMMRQKTENQP